MDSQNDTKLEHDALSTSQVPTPIGSIYAPSTAPVLTPRYHVIQDDAQPGQHTPVYSAQQETDRKP